MAPRNHSLEGCCLSSTVVGCSEAAPARIVCPTGGARFRDSHRKLIIIGTNKTFVFEGI